MADCIRNGVAGRKPPPAPAAGRPHRSERPTEVHRAATAGIAKRALAAPARSGEKPRDIVVGARPKRCRLDGLPSGQGDPCPERADADPVGTEALEMKLDGGGRAIPADPVAEPMEVEAGRELTVDAREHILVERGGEARPIVKGGEMRRGVAGTLTEKNERSRPPKVGPEGAKRRYQVLVVDPAGEGSADQCHAAGTHHLQRRERVVDVSFEQHGEAAQLHARCRLRQPLVRLAQGGGARFHGDKSGPSLPPNEGAQQDLRSLCRAGTELDDMTPVSTRRSKQGRQLVCVGVDQGALDAREIEPRRRSEERMKAGTLLVVEQPGGELFGLREKQTGAYLMQDAWQR